MWYHKDIKPLLVDCRMGHYAIYEPMERGLTLSRTVDTNTKRSKSLMRPPTTRNKTRKKTLHGILPPPWVICSRYGLLQNLGPTRPRARRR